MADAIAYGSSTYLASLLSLFAGNVIPIEKEKFGQRGTSREKKTGKSGSDLPTFIIKQN